MLIDLGDQAANASNSKKSKGQIEARQRNLLLEKYRKKQEKSKDNEVLDRSMVIAQQIKDYLAFEILKFDARLKSAAATPANSNSIIENEEAENGEESEVKS